MKRLATILALALALALPVSTFAATSTGSTPETLNAAATVSMTVPASATYTVNGANYETGPLAIANLQTNNATGMRVDMTVSDFTGPATVLTTKRFRAIQVQPTGWASTPNAARAVGFYATSATQDWLANRTTPTVTAGTFSINMQVAVLDVPVPGVYAGSLSFTASTNP